MKQSNLFRQLLTEDVSTTQNFSKGNELKHVFVPSCSNITFSIAATNLHGGLMTGIEMLNKAHENGTVPERSASLIIMLTDGQPDGCKCCVKLAVLWEILYKTPLQNSTI